MFDKNGKLLRKQSVYYFDKKTVSGVRFDKYHITDSNGRISKGERGFVNVAEQKVRGKKLSQAFIMWKRTENWLIVEQYAI